MVKEILTFYNVENFYPPDQNSTPAQQHSGLYNWDDYKYRLKVRKITNVFRMMKEDFKQLPWIIGLAEIGHLSVLEDLTNEDSPLKEYEIVYQPSQDSRRLSVALLFDKKKLSLKKTDFLKFKKDEDEDFDTRDILQGEFLLEGKKLHIFVCHMPSQRNNDAKKKMRNYIFEKLKEKVQALMAKNEAVIVMGDFNENPDAESLNLLPLSNPFERLFQNNHFSSYHGKKGVCFDQILYSEPQLLEQFHFNSSVAEIFNPLALRNKDIKHTQYPSRTYSGSRYMKGYSDHFPVVLKLS